MKVDFHPLNDVSFNFCIATWLQNYRNYYFRDLPKMRLDDYNIAKRKYFDEHHPEFTKLLKENVTVIASFPDSPEYYVGWACGDGDRRLYYVYVKPAYRRAGRAWELMKLVTDDQQRPWIIKYPTLNKGFQEAVERNGYSFETPKKGYQPKRIIID